MTKTTKLFTLLLIVIGGGIGGSRLKAKLEYEADGIAIKKLLAEYHAIGVPTTQIDFWKKYPHLNPEEEAADPVPAEAEFMQSTSATYASALVHIGTISELPLMKRQIQSGDKYRTYVEEKTRGLQDSAAMEGIPIEAIQPLAYHYCLMAYAECLDSEPDKVVVALDRASKLANLKLGAPIKTEATVGTFTWRFILQTCLRIAEVNPTMIDRLNSLMSAKGFVGNVNARGCVYEAFVEDISRARNLDSPLLDDRRSILKPVSDDQLRDAEEDRPYEYIPTSHAGRALLRERLEKWKPLVTRLATGDPYKVPTDDEYFDAFDLTTTRNLASLLRSAVDSREFLQPCQEFSNVFAITRSALQAKATTGQFPKTLAETGSTVDPDTYLYNLTESGFSLEVKRYSKAQKAIRVVNRTSFPVSNSLTTRQVQAEQLLIQTKSRSTQVALKRP